MPSNNASKLKAIIDQNIDNIDAYLVYADWLQQQGDPRGEFILLCHHADQPADGRIGRQHRSAIAAARDQYIEAWGAQLLGDLQGPLLRNEVALSWRLGFVDSLRINPGPAAQATLKRLPSQPCCRYLRSLDLSHSEIPELPDELGQLQQIREIDIRSCSLGRANIEPLWRHLTRVTVSEAPLPEAFVEQGNNRLEGPFWLLAGYYQTITKDIKHDQFQVILDHTELDEERYLVNWDDWSPAVCAALASEDDLDLSYRHWLVIAFQRMYYNEYYIAPAVRVLCKALGKALGEEWGNSKYLYELYVYGPGKQASRYAGLSKPTGCV